MVKLELRVAAGVVERTRRCLEDAELALRVYAEWGLLLPLIEVSPAPELQMGQLVAVLDDVRQPPGSGDAADYLSELVRRKPAALLDEDCTRALLDCMYDFYPQLIGAVETRFTLPFLTRRLQALLVEGICVKDLWTILEALLAVRGTQSPPPGPVDEAALCPTEDVYDAEVRRALCHLIVEPFLSADGTLTAHVVDETFGSALARALAAGDDVSPLRDAIAVVLVARHALVLLTTSETRPLLRDLVQSIDSQVAVLAYDDLPPYLSVRPAPPITLDQVEGWSV